MDVVITDKSIDFTKMYEGRTDKIFYRFDKKDSSGIFHGKYSGEVGEGTAKCILTEVSDDFFQPTK